MSKNQRPVLLLAPMESEFFHIRERINAKKQRVIGGYTFYEGEYAGYPVVAAKTLIGMVNASSAAVVGIMTYSPEFILLTGTSGAHAKTLRRGDIVLGEGFLDMGSFQTPHKPVGKTANVDEYVFSGAEVAEGQFCTVLPCDKNLLALAEAVEWNGNVFTGVIASGDQWNRELGKISYMHETFSSLCEEMEGYAVAQVASRFATPMLDVRVISNNEWIAGEEFDESVAVLAQQYCLNIVERFAKTKS